MINRYVVILKNYRKLKKRAARSDKRLLHRAAVTHCCYADAPVRTTEEQIRELTLCKLQGDFLRALCDATDQSLESLGSDGKLLLAWYSGVSRKEVAQVQNCSLRTLYRRCGLIFDKFVRNMKSNGCDESWFSQCKDMLEGAGQSQTRL